MKNMFAVSLLLALYMALTGASGCCDGVVNGNFCYRMFPDVQPWKNAELACQIWSNGTGHLANITSDSENSFVASLSSGYAWIGYNDSVSEGNWLWTMPLPPSSYTHWCSGEPNNSGDEDCAATNWCSRGYWNDYACTNALPYICKMPGIPVP
jgi:hypothetical protein